MSIKHPIISVTGASGAGTSTVRHTFDQIFRREGIKAAMVGGDAFHRFNREHMDAARTLLRRRVITNFSHFGPASQSVRRAGNSVRDLLGDRAAGACATTSIRKKKPKRWAPLPGTFTEWQDMPEPTDLSVL